ncbi:hypothetical protein E4T39_01946 [Aureobasidium subglaciale]|nr:hypothetical protein E4T39_01946 [Aureobasidium subglaciale]
MEASILRALAYAGRSSKCRASTTRLNHQCNRSFSQSTRRGLKEQKKGITAENRTSQGQPAANLSQDVGKEEKDHYERVVEHSKQSQMRSPWMHEGSDKPPVARLRSAGAMVKGKLLTTPSRMLKLILPLTTRDANKDRKNVEPLALLVHPQQPLSYLERLIQSELPVIKNESGGDKIPSVHFRAQDLGEEAIDPDKKHDPDDEFEDYEFDSADSLKIDGKTHRTGKLNESGQVDEKPVNDSQQPSPEHTDFVRWSPSTEIGDFIRDAARGKEFSVDIEGAPEPIYVAVPSFNDRTYYLRMRLRKTAKQISSLADIKTECDKLAHRSAQRVAQGGFAILVGWWGSVYVLTFQTELGWDVMEPVTYLVGLSTLIGGYMWFLYHNREVSYRSAMNFTVSKRQDKLYQAKGFDVSKWDGLVEEGNRLRREIKMVAEEYDVDWDEAKEAGDEKVAKALRQERRRKQTDKDDDDDEGKRRKKSREDDDD